MSHARQLIRESIATLLTGLPTTGSNVFQSRVYRLTTNDLPALLIYSTDESITRSAFSKDITLDRELNIRVQGIAKATTSLDDTLDTIAEEVEDALGGTSPAGVEELFLTSATYDYQGEGEQPVGLVNLEFLVRYRTIENDSSAIL